MQEEVRARRLILRGAVVLAAAALLAQAVAAQQLNPRKGAPPDAESKKSRLVARAELQGQDEGASLKREELTVTRTCGDVQIGGQPPPEAGRSKSLVGSQRSLRERENNTVITNVVNICR